MSYEKLTNEEKLNIICNKAENISDILSVITDAMSYRLEKESTKSYWDCLSFLKEAENEIKLIEKLN